MGTPLTNQNSIAEEIKSRLKSGNACYHSVRNLLSSRLLSKNLKIKIYRTAILPVVLYGCETWSLALREERKLRVFENRVLRRIFGPRRDEETGEWRRLHNVRSHGTIRTVNTTNAAALKTTTHPQTIRCNSISNAPDDGRMYPKHVELRMHQ